MIFFLYNCIIGIKNGFIKSLFISISFVVKAVATYFIFRAFSNILLADKNLMLIINSIKDILIKKAPNLSMATDILNNIILVVLIYIFLSIILFIVFKILKDIADDESLKLSDQILGFLYGALKSTVFVMLLVYGTDKISDYVFTAQIKDFLSSSSILPLMYTYNIFINLFGS